MHPPGFRSGNAEQSLRKERSIRLAGKNSCLSPNHPLLCLSPTPSAVPGVSGKRGNQELCMNCASQPQVLIVGVFSMRPEGLHSPYLAAKHGCGRIPGTKNGKPTDELVFQEPEQSTSGSQGCRTRFQKPSDPSLLPSEQEICAKPSWAVQKSPGLACLPKTQPLPPSWPKPPHPSRGGQHSPPPDPDPHQPLSLRRHVCHSPVT